MQNWFFFPILPNSKQPALEGDWRLHATDDEVQIDAWEAEGYNLGLDCERSGLTVVDLDGGPVGENSLMLLEAEYGKLPDTYERRTPKGGRHLYLQGECPSTVAKIGEKIDTRGRGGYVVFSGYTPDGVYSLAQDRPVAGRPEWVRDLAEARTHETGLSKIDTLDMPVNVQRGVNYLLALPAVSQGNGADARTYEVAAELREYGISAEKSVDLMLKHYKCQPQDDRFEAFVQRKVANAWEYAQNEPGAWGATPLHERFATYLNSEAEHRSSEGGGAHSPFAPLSEAEQDALPEPTWLRQDIIPDDSVCMMYGPPGSYKSFIALDLGLTMAASVAGWGQVADEPLTVVYVAGEGPRSVARVRRPAWRLVRGVEYQIPFHLVRNMPRADDEQSIVDFIEAMRPIKPDFIVIDTWARFVVGLNENDSRDASRAIDALEFIKRELKCSILVIHHTGKENTGPRGSSAIVAGFDSQFEVIPHKHVKAVAVHNRRHKDADEIEEPWCFEGKEVAGSLVFQPITQAAFKSLTQQEDAFGQKAVARTLAALNAKGPAKAVTTRILATQMYAAPQGEDPDVTLGKITTIERKLQVGAKGRLELFVDGTGKHLAWFLPD